MSLTKCRECGHQVSKKSKTCPSCGITKPYKSTFKRVLVISIIVMIALFVVGLFTDDSSPNDRFASVALNVRTGPGVDYEATGVLESGERLKVLSDSLGWIKIESSKGLSGWVSKSYTVNSKPIVEPDDSEKETVKEKSTGQQNQTVSRWMLEPDRIRAKIEAEDYAKRQLKSPSTAEFPSSFGYDYEANIDFQQAQIYIVRSYVDAQNSFGATLRTHFTAKVQQHKENQWRVLEFNFHE